MRFQERRCLSGYNVKFDLMAALLLTSSSGKDVKEKGHTP